MAARINLLPWREWRRRRRNRAFFAGLGAALLAGAALIGAAGWRLEDRIVAQQERNRFLERGIAALDRQIAEIGDLRRQREQLLARMDVIRGLQGNRPVVVRIFDELVNTLAEGLHYQRLELREGAFIATGLAASNDRISALMRNLDASEWFAAPNLKRIEEAPERPEQGPGASAFQLSFRQARPRGPET